MTMKQMIKCVLWVLLNFALQFIVQVAMSIYAVAQGMRDDAVLNAWLMDNLLLTTLISNVIFIAIAGAVFAGKKVRLFPDSEREKHLGVCIVPCVAAFLYSLGFSLLFEGNSAMIQNSVEYYSEKVSWLGTIMMVVDLLILAPIAEELLCRRIMLDGLKKRYSSLVAVVISAVIFGAMHIMAGGPALAIGAAVMGLLLGMVYVLTGSLRAAIIVHAAANLPDFLLSVVTLPEGTISAVIAAVCLAAAVLLMLWWSRHHHLNSGD